jgi:hypothetical protein
MAWPKVQAAALSVAIAALLVVTPSAFAGEGEKEAKAAQAAKEHSKEQAKEHAKEHPKEHPDAKKHRPAKPAILQAFALEHGGEDVAHVISDMLPEGSRVAFHRATGKLVVLTDDRGMDYVHYLLKQLDVPPTREAHHGGHGACEACLEGHGKRADHGDEDDDDDAYPEDGEHGEEHDGDDDEDCDEYPEDEDAASAGPLTKEALAVAIKAHIEDATKEQGGAFHVEDAKAGVTLELTLDKVHEERLATMGEGVYFACSDFKAANGQLFDVDFFMKDGDAGLAMTELHIHKEDGVARYTWHESNGVWSRREVQ